VQVKCLDIEANTTFVVIFLCAMLGDNYLAFVATHSLH